MTDPTYGAPSMFCCNYSSLIIEAVAIGVESWAFENVDVSGSFVISQRSIVGNVGEHEVLRSRNINWPFGPSCPGPKMFDVGVVDHQSVKPGVQDLNRFVESHGLPSPSSSAYPAISCFSRLG